MSVSPGEVLGHGAACCARQGTGESPQHRGTELHVALAGSGSEPAAQGLAARWMQCWRQEGLGSFKLPTGHKGGKPREGHGAAGEWGRGAPRSGAGLGAAGRAAEMDNDTWTMPPESPSLSRCPCPLRPCPGLRHPPEASQRVACPGTWYPTIAPLQGGSCFHLKVLVLGSSGSILGWSGAESEGIPGH